MSICWHDGNGWHEPCYAGGNNDRHDHDAAFSYGRCRSGKRWFWAANDITGLRDAPAPPGLADTEGARGSNQLRRQHCPHRIATGHSHDRQGRSR